jgi:hypothetical protein
MCINEIIGFQVESTAEWRRHKAEQFLDDRRNLEAAEALDKLAAEVSQLNGSDTHQQNDRLGGALLRELRRASQ